MPRALSWLAAAILVIAGAAAALGLGKGFFARVGDLERQLQSSNWNVAGSDAALDDALRALHSGQQDIWPIHLLAGSGNSFPLGDDARRDTISDLADHAPVPGTVYQRETTTISRAYAILVTQAAHDRSIPLSVRQSAIALAAKFKWDLDDFVSFPTDTNPSADALSLWDRVTASLPQSSRCRGTVMPKWKTASPAPTPIAAPPAAPISVNIRIMRRYGVLEIVRPWLEPNLLSAAARSPNDQINRFFKPGGALAQIPSALVVLMPDQVLVSPEGPTARTALRNLIASSLCCHVNCLGVEFDLEDEAGWTSAGDLNGNRKYPRPVIYAVIAHRERKP